MAGLVLDGAGQVKMETLNTCIALHQRIHGLVENYAISVKNNKPEKTHLNNIRRNLPIMAAKLKGQFGMISDLVTAAYNSIGSFLFFALFGWASLDQMAKAYRKLPAAQVRQTGA